MGMQVLKDLSNGISKKPEDYVPHDLYNQFCYDPNSFDQNHHPVLGNLEDYSKILIGRNPFDRLFSAWSDKSRAFRHENGSINFDAAAKETTWLWGERQGSPKILMSLIFTRRYGLLIPVKVAMQKK